MTKINGGTVYDWVKQEKETMPKETVGYLNKTFKQIEKWFAKKRSTYYMLLSNERKDYTTFNFIQQDYEKGIQELKEVIAWRGNLHSIDYNDAMDTYEIWVDIPGMGLFMYLLFPCNDFVVEVAA